MLKTAHYKHCVIKEELDLSESDEEGHEKTRESDGTLKDRIKCENELDENIDIYDKRQTTLDLLLKSENSESEEQIGKSNVTYNEKSSVTVKTAKSENIDVLMRKLAKTLCRKCKVKRAVIRGNARCRKCQSKLTYNCVVCNTTYRDYSKLSYHLESKHDAARQLQLCRVCGKTFACRSVLLEHQKTREHYSNPQVCAKCGKTYNSKHKQKHDKICGKEAPHKCDKCSFTAFYRSNLVSHAKEKHPSLNDSKWNIHVKDKYAGSKVRCKNCNKLFTNRRSIYRHLKVYCNKAKQFECHHCGHKAYRKNQILIHLNQVHYEGCLVADQPRICNYCESIVARPEPMRNHLAQCESAPLSFRRILPKEDCGSGKFRNCEYCGVTLKPYEHVKYHLERCEAAPMEIRCQGLVADQPDLDTALKNLAKAHCVNCNTKEPIKHGVRRCKKCKTMLNYTCERCPKSHRDFYRLRDHLQTKHLTNKTFHHCDKCDRSYGRLKDLKLHLKTHHSFAEPTTRIYKCSKCGKSYNRDASFRKHRISCSQEPRFHCHKCSYRTHFKSSLVQHFSRKLAKCSDTW